MAACARCSVKLRVRHHAPSRSLQFTTRQAAAAWRSSESSGSPERGNRIAMSDHAMALRAMTHCRTVRLRLCCNRREINRPLQRHYEEERSDDVAIRLPVHFLWGRRCAARQKPSPLGASSARKMSSGHWVGRPAAGGWLKARRKRSFSPASSLRWGGVGGQLPPALRATFLGEGGFDSACEKTKIPRA